MLSLVSKGVTHNFTVSMNSALSESAGIIAPPPVLYLGALVMGYIMHVISPQPIFVSFSVGGWLGILLLGLSAFFARWSFVTMRKVGTTANPRKPSAALVINGPFRLSRNPIYLAMTGLYLGVTFFANSWWPLVLLAPLLLVMHWGVILREERYLAKQFGQAYLEYKSRVRRWL